VRDLPRLRRRRLVGALPAPSHDEDAMLEMTAAPRRPTSRLSCQIALDADLDGPDGDDA
jgi:ferredoxin